MKATKPQAQRAELIRGRRRVQTRKSKRVLGKREQRVAAPTLPPVMARANTGSLSREAKPLRRVRRRYDIPLNSQGLEARLPSLPQVRLGWRLVSTLLVAALVYLLYQFLDSPSYKLDVAQVAGSALLTSGEINSELDLTGKHIFTIDPVEVKQQLLDAFPEFQDVAVSVELPNSVVITVTERTPVLVWKQEDVVLFVDAGGTSFPMRHEHLLSFFPVVEALGSPPPLVFPTEQEQDSETAKPEGVSKVGDSENKMTARPFLTADMVSAILMLSKVTPQGVVIRYDPVHGLGWKDKRGREVYFGEVKDIQMKLLVYETLLQRLKTENIQPVLVSVEYVHAPYYRLER